MDDLYYDPWDVEIDLDPYPTYRRLRDESPLYYNERHNFWGISRYADVDAGLKDTTRLSSAKGDILEVVLTDPMIPAGVLINEDPRCTPSTAPSCRAHSHRRRCAPSRTRCARSAPPASIRWLEVNASTSSRTSGQNSR